MSDFKFSQDWFSQHIPQWSNHLSKFVDKPDLKFLEVGTFEGRAAVWLLQNVLTHPTSTMVCIDNWKFNDQGLKLDSSQIEQAFDHNIRATNRASNVIKKSGNSHEVLKTLSLDYYDFIYIDAAHLAPNVLEDAILSWRLLKLGGIMIFDDYLWGVAPNILDRPKLGIDAFLSVYQNKYKLIHKKDQVVIEKIK